MKKNKILNQLKKEVIDAVKSGYIVPDPTDSNSVLIGKIVIAQQHVFYIIACADKSATREEIETFVNEQIPTGVKSKWAIPEGTEIGGHTYPVICESNPDRLHYYLNC